MGAQAATLIAGAHSFSPPDVHNRTDRNRQIWEDRATPRAAGLRREPMLFIIGALIALTAAVVIPKVRVAGGVNAAPLGWVSEQWLAEYRRSHPS